MAAAGAIWPATPVAAERDQGRGAEHGRAGGERDVIRADRRRREGPGQRQGRPRGPESAEGLVFATSQGLILEAGQTVRPVDPPDDCRFGVAPLPDRAAELVDVVESVGPQDRGVLGGRPDGQAIAAGRPRGQQEPEPLMLVLAGVNGDGFVRRSDRLGHLEQVIDQSAAEDALLRERPVGAAGRASITSRREGRDIVRLLAQGRRGTRAEFRRSEAEPAEKGLLTTRPVAAPYPLFAASVDGRAETGQRLDERADEAEPERDHASGPGGPAAMPGGRPAAVPPGSSRRRARCCGPRAGRTRRGRRRGRTSRSPGDRPPTRARNIPSSPLIQPRKPRSRSSIRPG